MSELRVEVRGIRPGVVTLYCTDGYFNTEYTCNDLLEIGSVIVHAVENFYYQRACHEATKWLDEKGQARGN